VVKPRQPLYDLNPFDSILLILRRVVSAPGLFPRCFPSSLSLDSGDGWAASASVERAESSRAFPGDQLISYRLGHHVTVGLAISRTVFGTAETRPKTSVCGQRYPQI